MKKTVSRIVIALLLISLLTGCKGKKQEVKQPELLSPVSVSDKSEKATYREIYNMNANKGYVVPYPVELSFNKDGVFEKFHVAMGDKVKKGQVLASQSDKSYQQEIESIEKNYEETKRAYKNAKRIDDVEVEIIDVKLSKEKAMLKQASADTVLSIQADIDKLKLSRKSLLKTTKMKYKEYQNQLDEMSTQIADRKKIMANNNIVAPFDGVVSYTSKIESGDEVSSGRAVIQIMDTTKTYITCEQNKMHLLKQASMIYAIINGEKYELEVSNSLNKEVNELTLPTMLSNCNFTFKKQSKEIEYGQVGMVCIITNYKEKALSVKNTAIYADGIDKRYVYRKKDGQKEKIYVRTGVETDIYTEILSGIEEGDVVISD